MGGHMSALEGTKYITRGFECYQSVKFNKTIHQQRRAVLESVLTLQHHQQQTSKPNPDQIAAVCSEHSRWARFWATDLGMKHAISSEGSWKDLFDALKEVNS